jgi:hypothetical protein
VKESATPVRANNNGAGWRAAIDAVTMSKGPSIAITI